jgi:carboxyl-terminal processing protease
MKTNKLILLAIPLLLMAIACQTILFPSSAGSPEEKSITQSPSLPFTTGADVETTPEPALSSSDDFQPSATPSPSETITPSPSATLPLITNTTEPTALPKDLQISIFEELWAIVDNEYLYPDFNGLDWDAIYTEYHSQVDAGLTNAEFYLLMNDMISALGDDHSRYVTPEEVRIENAEYGGNSDYVGVGILVTAIPERNRAVVLAVFPGSPADEGGLKPRDSILRANGELILDENGSLRDLVRGPEGTQVSLIVQSPGEEAREMILTRQRITGSLPVLSTKFDTNGGETIGYIQIITFSDGTVDEQVRDALLGLTQETELDGLILDNRLNNGGASTVMTPILSYFTSGTLGYFVSREGRYPLTLENAEDINGSLSTPLVVLISKETVSFGEIFSGILKDLERAYLIGDTTEGNIETLWGYDFPDGSRAWIAHDTFMPFNNPDEDWEITGVSPDLFIEDGWYDYSLENDPAIEAALDYFSHLSQE